MNSLNPKVLSLPKSGKTDSPKATTKDAIPTHFEGKTFLRTVPWDWLIRAAKLPGKTLQVAIGIWHLSGLTKSRTVKLSQKTLRELGVNRNAAYRGLEWLENEGLVSVERHRGRNSMVTILDA